MTDKTSKYLDPKNDLTFRKIFGEHPHIMKSFLNSVMPFKKGNYIKDLIYQDPAMIPELPELKHSVVDVRCTDNYGRKFIVEMQMYWTSSFKSRMLFNAGKAYVKQLQKKQKYNSLCPIYGLSLVNENFLKEEEYKNKYYHHYKMLHTEISEEVIEGIELIFIELEKFSENKSLSKELRNLWLRFLTEIDENTKKAPDELLKEEAIKEALECLQISAFTEEELAYYDKYWDSVRIEQARMDDMDKKYTTLLNNKGKELEEAKAREKKAKASEKEAKAREEEAKAREKEAKAKTEEALHKLKQSQYKLAKKMLQYKVSMAEIVKETGLSEEEIKGLM